MDAHHVDRKFKKVFKHLFDAKCELNWFEDRLTDSKTQIGKLLAKKKKDLSEYYDFERDNSYFDISEEDAKEIIAEKNELKKEVKILDLYLLDLAKVASELPKYANKGNKLTLMQKIDLYVPEALVEYEQKLEDAKIQSLKDRIEIALLESRLKDAKKTIYVLVEGIQNDDTAEVFGEIINTLTAKCKVYERNTKKE